MKTHDSTIKHLQSDYIDNGDLDWMEIEQTTRRGTCPHCGNTIRKGAVTDVDPDERRKILELIRHFCGLGYGLHQINDGRRLNLDPALLLRLVSESGCKFHDEIEYAALVFDPECPF